MKTSIAKLTLAVLFMITAANAQSTEFTYQGRLLDGTAAPTANYDFEFRLYPSSGGGAPVLGTQQRLNVPVATGIFTVKLDFGPTFDGTERWLEISVKPPVKVYYGMTVGQLIYFPVDGEIEVK